MEQSGDPQRSNHGVRVATGAIALTALIASIAIAGLDRAGARLADRTATLSAEIESRIRPRPPIPGAPPGPSIEEGQADLGGFDLFTTASRQLVPTQMERLTAAFDGPDHPDQAVIRACVEAHQRALETALRAARLTHGVSRKNSDLHRVDVFEHMHLARLIRAAALDAATRNQPARRVEYWATAFQHARDLSDHSSLLMNLVATAVLEEHEKRLVQSLARQSLPVDEATRLAAFLDRMQAHWPDPAGSMLREAEWLGRMQEHPEQLEVPLPQTWRHGFSWTLTLAAGFDHSLQLARAVDPLLGRPWPEIERSLRDFRADHSPVTALGLDNPQAQLANLVQTQARLCLLRGLLRLHAGLPLDDLPSPDGGPLTIEHGVDQEGSVRLRTSERSMLPDQELLVPPSILRSDSTPQNR